MILTPSRFAEIGQTLYGDHWRPRMARALNRSETMIRGYEAGRPIPKEVRETICRIIAAAKQKLAEIETIVGCSV